MKKNIKVNLGDIFVIELDAHKFALGIVLHVSKTFKRGMIVGIFNKLFENIDNVSLETIGNIGFVDLPNYVSTDIFKSGNWKIVKNLPELKAKYPVPALIAGNTLYQGDKIIKDVVSSQDRKIYPQLTSEGMYFVENKLKRIFNL